MDELIDSHCHLTFDALRDQVGEVIDRAVAAGVKRFVTIATDLADADRALALSSVHESVHVVAGIHPHEAGKVQAGWDGALLEVVRRGDVFAVGEMGLDYHYDFADRAQQARVFRRQMEIAREVTKPVVIHCREAHADVMTMIADFPELVKVVFHCFTGTMAEATAIVQQGYWISLTGVVTFRRSEELRAVARMLPAERLMVETDSPYLSPVPVRNVRPNEPAHLVHTAACVARERSMTPSELAELTTANAVRFFSLPQ